MVGGGLMSWKYIVRTAAIVAGLALAASAAKAQWQFGGTFECVGRAFGQQSVKVNCIQEIPRGNRIFTNTWSATVTGPVARHYVGEHKDCWHIASEETRFNEDIITCPGIPKWW
jgi:hypothetical protein